jgi:hypothetical protein
VGILEVVPILLERIMSIIKNQKNFQGVLGQVWAKAQSGHIKQSLGSCEQSHACKNLHKIYYIFTQIIHYILIQIIHLNF